MSKSRVWFSGPALATQNNSYWQRDSERIHRLEKNMFGRKLTDRDRRTRNRNSKRKGENYSSTTVNFTGQGTRSELEREGVWKEPIHSQQRTGGERAVYKAHLQGPLAKEGQRERDILIQGGIVTSQESWR